MPNAFNRRRPARQGARAAGRARKRGGARTRVQRARESASLHDRLARVLDTPHLARLVPQLAPATLHQLIRHRGLDACGELVAAATPGQLTAVFDIDLWRSARPGQPDAFDEERFAEWVEALVDMGEAVAARTVAAVDERLIAAGLSRYVRVLDPGIFMPTSPDRDDEAVDPFPFEGPSCECGGYVIRARRIDGWEAMVAFVRTLAATHPECFAAVMQGCRRLSNSAPEIDGLDELLPEPAQALHDVGAERGGRRAQQGYLAPADARAFLEMSRQPAHHRGSASPSRNPIAAAYFRAADRPAATGRHAAGPGAQIGDTGTAADVSASIAALVELLAEAGLTPERPRALLEGHTSGQRPLMVHTLMEYVRDADEAAYAARTSELAFLTNALIAGARYNRGRSRCGRPPMRLWPSAIWASSTGRRMGSIYLKASS